MVIRGISQCNQILPLALITKPLLTIKNMQPKEVRPVMEPENEIMDEVQLEDH